MSERPNAGQKGHNQAWKAKTRPKGTKGDKRAISSHVSLFSQAHAWVSRVASHATALNIGIIIFIQCNHSSRFHTSLLNTQVVFGATTFLLFFLHHHYHRHISIVFPPPPPPHFYCFPFTTTATTFLLFSLHHHHHRHISIVFPRAPPPHFYCFPSTTTATFLEEMTVISDWWFFMPEIQPAFLKGMYGISNCDCSE